MTYDYTKNYITDDITDPAPSAKYLISTFYKFQKDENPEKTKRYLEELAVKTNSRGLIIIGVEGFNATICSTNKEDFESFKQGIRDYFKLADLFFKDSFSNITPFRRFRVKIRDEIVTLGNPNLVPHTPDGKNHHLTPTDWNEVIKTETPIIIDTRNWYETKIGTFKGALNPMTDKFTEFPSFLEKKEIPKDKKILIFCTGGIRCEKGILEMQRQGYKNTYQLYGGILNYLTEYPNDQFEGECFVFDHRVSLDQAMQPSKQYKLCPHCGQPGKTEIDCARCDKHGFICENCAQIEFKKNTCSKNCAHHYQLYPKRKAIKPTPKEVLAYKNKD